MREVLIDIIYVIIVASDDFKQPGRWMISRFPPDRCWKTRMTPAISALALIDYIATKPKEIIISCISFCWVPASYHAFTIIYATSRQMHSAHSLTIITGQWRAIRFDSDASAAFILSIRGRTDGKTKHVR